MRIIISFMCGLLFAATIYAQPGDSDEDRVLTEADMVAVPSQDRERSLLNLEANQLKKGSAFQAEASSDAMATMTAMANEPKKTGGIIPTEMFPQPDKERAATQEKSPIIIGGDGGLASRAPAPVIAEPIVVNAPSPAAGQVEENAISPKLENLIDRLTTLEAQNVRVQAQVNQINEHISLIEERLIGNVGVVGSAEAKVAGEKTEKEYLYDKISRRIDNLKDRIGHKVFMIIVLGVGAILLLVFGYIIFPRREKQSFPGSYSHEVPEILDQDFNPMEGQEGIAAKLNLARAYVDMGKDEDARMALYDVLSHGSDAEQAEAKELLGKIKHPDLDR